MQSKYPERIEFNRESKEITLNRGEHMKNDFKPSPEVRITSPQYHPSLSSYPDPGVVSGRFTPPNVHSSTVKVFHGCRIISTRAME